MASGDEASGKAFSRPLLRRVLRFAVPYRRAFFASVLLLLLLSALSLAIPLVIRHTIDTYLPARSAAAPMGPVLSTEDARAGVVRGALALGAIGAILFLCRFLQLRVINQTGQRVIHDLRIALFRHITTRSLRFFDRNPVGKLVTRTTNDVESLNELFTSGIDMVFYDLAKILIIVAIMFWVDWHMALVTLAVVPFIAAWSFWFQRQARRLFRLVREKITALNTFLNESITGIRVIQAFRRETKMKAAFIESNDDLREAHVETVGNYSLFYPGMEILSVLGQMAIVLSANELLLGGRIQRGDLVLFWMLFSQFIEPLRQLADKFNVLQAAMAAAERIFRVLDDPETLDVRTDAPKIDTSRGHIRFEDVSFTYDGRKKVLKKVSFEALPGQRIALVGPTGSGKSTIVNLLMRFYDPDEGRILLDGVDIRTLDPSSLRRRIGVVLQDVFLFAGTLRENLSIGDTTIPDERLLAASDAVQAGGVIRRLGGLDAPVMERGATLSTGEKQLVSFARTLAHEPAVLVLDEATASIDTESERLVQKALDRLLEGRTSLIIAHRLSTIRKADRILVLHHGELIEDGSHGELIERNGLYARLHRLQFKL